MNVFKSTCIAHKIAISLWEEGDDEHESGLSHYQDLYSASSDTDAEHIYMFMSLLEEDYKAWCETHNTDIREFSFMYSNRRFPNE